MTPIGDLIPLFARDHLDVPEVREAVVRIAWNRAVGDKIREISTIEALDKKTLRISVPHSQWQRSLRSMQGDILNRMNAYIGAEVVTHLTISVQT